MKTVLAALAALLLMLLPFLGCEGPRQRQPRRVPVTTVRVVAFTATWCGPCQRAKPFLAQIRSKSVDVRIVDIDANPDMAREYNIVSVPTFLVYVGDRQVARTSDISVVVAMTRSQ